METRRFLHVTTLPLIYGTLNSNFTSETQKAVKCHLSTFEQISTITRKLWGSSIRRFFPSKDGGLLVTILFISQKSADWLLSIGRLNAASPDSVNTIFGTQHTTLVELPVCRDDTGLHVWPTNQVLIDLINQPNDNEGTYASAYSYLFKKSQFK